MAQPCSPALRRQSQSNFMHDASFAADDQHYEMQLPPAVNTHPCAHSGQLLTGQNNNAAPFGGMQRTMEAGSHPQHAGSSSEAWQQDENGLPWFANSASMRSNASALPHNTAIINQQFQRHSECNSFQQLAEASARHRDTQLRSSHSLQQMAEAAPHQQLVFSRRSEGTLRQEQHVEGAAWTTESSEAWMSRQRTTPAQPAAVPSNPAARRLQARRTIYVCDIDPKVCTHALFQPPVPCTGPCIHAGPLHLATHRRCCDILNAAQGCCLTA